MASFDQEEQKSDAQIFLASREKSKSLSPPPRKSKSPAPRKSKSPSPALNLGPRRSGSSRHVRHSSTSSAVDRLTSRFASRYGIGKYGSSSYDPEIDDEDLEKPRVYKSVSERRNFRYVRDITPDSEDEEVLESRTRWNVLINKPVLTDLNIEDSIADRKPAMKAMEDAIADSYHSAKRTVERCSSSVADGGFSVSRRPGYEKRYGGRFKELEDSAFFVPRPSKETDIDGELLYHKPLLSVSERNTSWINSERYAAPARNLTSQPLDSTSWVSAGRYSAPARNIGRSGSMEPTVDHSLTARPTYSRYTGGDPDYFDYDLESSVNMFKKHQNNYVPQFGPRHWEHKLITEASRQEGVKPLAPHLFTKDYGDTRYQNTGYLSCALRTPSFWTNRFEKLLGSGPSVYGSTGTSGNELGDPTSSYTYSSAFRSPYELSSSNMRRDKPPKSRFLRDTPDPESDYSAGEDEDLSKDPL